MRNNQCICSECKHELDSQADFCTFCGALFRTDQTCSCHDDVKATSVCVVCNKPICYLCVTHDEGAGYCRDHYPSVNPSENKSTVSSDKYEVEYRIHEGALLILKQAEQFKLT